MGCLATLGVAFGAATVHANVDRDAMAERLRPVGQLCLQGEECGRTAAAAAAPASDAGGIDGPGIYNSVCMACHETGAAGAPVRGTEDDWASRIDQGIETLYEHSINGIGAMPPRGGNPNLSDEEVMAAANHLLEPVMDDLPEIGGEEATAEEGAAEGEADIAATEGEADAEAAPAEEETAGNGNGLDGEALYAGGGCAACHGTGAAGAPRLGEAGDWGERLEQDISELYAHAINGIGAMPPKGGNMSLSDEEVEAIVDYMVAESE
nr:c-type cytochrome [Halomonas populi]